MYIVEYTGCDDEIDCVVHRDCSYYVILHNKLQQRNTEYLLAVGRIVFKRYFVGPKGVMKFLTVFDIIKNECFRNTISYIFSSGFILVDQFFRHFNLSIVVLDQKPTEYL